MKKIVIVFLILAAGSIGFTAGYYMQPSQDTSEIYVDRLGSDGLINPILDYDAEKDVFAKEFAPITDLLEDYIAQQQESGKVSRISIYFRSLEEGHWYGINENEQFIPASLLKVPLMIAYLKNAEKDPQLLKQTLTYEPSPTEPSSLRQYYVPEHSVEIGKSYTVAQLLEYMIVYSDNNAKNMLFRNIPNELLLSTFEDLDLGEVNKGSLPSDNITSPLEISTVYRLLYNASYLSPEMSRYALALLAKDTFHNGIKNGLPSKVTYAGKFGERSRQGEYQLHDCGIVYYPKNPYVLCVMTQGTSFEDLEPVIAHISREIYKAVATSGN